MKQVRASVLLLTFNQEAFVKEALQSLLNQNFDNLEIVVSDDCSSDETWTIIKQVTERYKGRKSLILNRNSSNLGLISNYTKAFELSSGDLIFTAAGDDISLPDRCSASIEHWMSLNAKPDLVATDAFDMTLDGDIMRVKVTDHLDEWNLRMWAINRPFIFGASHMMTRRLVALNHLDPLLAYEDQCFLFRALLMGGAAHLNKPFVYHRRGGISQQKSNYRYDAKKNLLISSALHGIRECQQMLSDANIFDGNDDIKKVLLDKIKAHEYAYEMLQSTSLFQQTQMLFKVRFMPFFKRFRYFSFVALPRLNKAVMGIKRVLKS